MSLHHIIQITSDNITEYYSYTTSPSKLNLSFDNVAEGVSQFQSLNRSESVPVDSPWVTSDGKQFLSRNWDLFLLTCPDGTLTIYDLGSGVAVTTFSGIWPLGGISTHIGELSGRSGRCLVL